MDTQRLRFRMERMHTNHFELHEREEKGEIEFKYSIAFGHISPTTPTFSVRIGLAISQAEKEVLGIEQEYTFGIHPDDWEGARQKDGKVIIETPTIEAILTQCIGALRGVLHCKLENTPYSSFILPPVNISQMAKKPHIIE